MDAHSMPLVLAQAITEPDLPSFYLVTMFSLAYTLGAGRAVVSIIS
jgi:hypothetical protein